MKNYVLKTDIQYLLASKANFEEVKTLVDTKIEKHELNSEI
jgi:hypothetical protein